MTRVTAPDCAIMYNLINTNFCASLAFGGRTGPSINPYRMGKFSRGPVPNASKHKNSEALTWVRLGPYSERRLKLLKASHVWAVGGARVQVRRSIGDVLDGLSPEKLLRPSGRSRAKAKSGRSGSHSELLSRMDGIG